MHEGRGTIRIPIEIKAGGEGRAYRVLPDGQRIEGSVQSFVRVEPLAVQEGGWLFNPTTNEVHRVVGVDPLTIETARGVEAVTWDDAHAALLVVR